MRSRSTSGAGRRTAVLRRTLLPAALLCAASLANQAASAPSMLVNARIHTMDAATGTAGAMVWDEHGRVLAVGEGSALAQRFPDARRIDAQGHTVVPGLIDAHGHLMNLGVALMRADLVGAGSRLEVMERLRAFARELPADAWLLGRGWDQNDWAEKVFPTAAELDAVFPDRPVWLERIDGHAGWANSAALRLATRDLSGDWQPEGGRILRDADGRPTGVLVDTAMALIEQAVPPMGAAQSEAALERALAAAVRQGLTGVHDAGVSLEQLGLLRRLADAGRLPLRVYAMADGDGAALAALCAMGRYAHPSGRLEMRSVKFYADGALGSRGAALLADYSDEPGHRGLLVTEPAALEAGLRKAHACGVQAATHAIGDRGNRVVLDAYARVLGEQASADHRWRIEHAQVVFPGDIPRLAELGVIASMQPTHATSDMPWAAQRVGEERLAGAYAWQRMREAGVRLALGSDFPVEQVDPLLGLQAAVTRQDAEGRPEGGWLPAQRLTPAQALQGFTRDAAYAGFAEDDVGTLAVGKRADFVLLDGDPLAVPAGRIADLRVLATYLDGQPVFRGD